MGLPLRSRNLAGFRKRFEVTQVLNDSLFRVATRQGFPRTGELAHFEFLQNRNHRAAACGRTLEDHFTGVIGVSVDGTPRDSLSRFVVQYF
jgi:hypothetical protein